MASIFDRAADILKSNINAMLDKLEDPDKMIDQLLRESRENLAEVKAQTAGIMAQEKKTKAERDDIANEMDKFMGLAQKAVAAGKDKDAKTFLVKKNELAGRLSTAESAYQAAHASADQMRKLYNKLVDDISNLEARKNAIKATSAAADAQEAVNRLSAKVETKGVGSKFDEMEAKANDRLARAQASAELDELPEDPADALAAKYEKAETMSVDDELAALKAAMAGEI